MNTERAVVPMSEKVAVMEALHAALRQRDALIEALRELDANCENRSDEPFIAYVRRTVRAALKAAP